MKKIKREYTWGDGFRNAKTDAQAVGEELEALGAGKLKTVTAETVVKAARSKSSAMHDIFEWNNTKAAAQYRLEQGRSLLRSVKVTITPSGGESFRVRALITHPDESGDYVATVVALSDDDLRAQLVARALRELATWRQRYTHLAELAVVFQAMDELEGMPESHAGAGEASAAAHASL